MRAYGLLLRLYPRSFRDEYGHDMREMFARRRRDASNPFAVATLWIGTVAEVVFNAGLVHADILTQDLAYTARMLRRAPGFAATAVVIVALGIGATTAAFSVADFVLLRPLPFREPARLVKIWQSTSTYPTLELSAPNYRDWTAGAKSFESTAVYRADAITLATAGEPQRLSGTRVSASLFRTLGVAPIAGRGFADADDTADSPGTLVLSYRLWQTEFGGDRAVVGTTVLVDDEPHTIVGIMPREFRFPSSDTLFWRPNRFTDQEYQNRNDYSKYAVGRLRPEVSIAEARAELEAAAARSRQAFPENRNIGATVVPLSGDISPRARLMVVALSAAAGCVLLIACANLANLLLVRALARRRELAVRAALGAGRERLVRQLMTESLVLAFAGGALGIALAIAAVPLLSRLVPATLPLAAPPSVDLRVLRFALGLVVATGLAFGLAPIVRAGRAGAEALREGSRSSGGHGRLRAALVVVEIVVSIVLLVCAGLLMRALLTIQRIDPGFQPEGVLTMRLPLGPQYAPVAPREALYARVLEEVRALPGVTSAGMISFLPMSSMRGGIWPVSVSGAPADMSDTKNVSSLRFVTPGYFAALAIPLKRGRDVAPTDDVNHEAVAVVSESFVRKYWPGLDPIGRRLNFALADRVVVGVAGDVMFRGLERASEPQIYLSSKQVRDGFLTFYCPKELAVRASVPPASLAGAVRAIVRRADPKLPITNVQTLSDMVDLETASRSVQVRVLSAFAGIAFLLAAVGIHGLLSFAVSQRVREIGVRIALGAQPRDILSLVVTRSVILAAAGVVPGLAIAYAAGRSLEALLAGVKPADAPTMIAAIGLAVVMTIAGTVLPTFRALRVNPITAMRAE